MSNLEKLLKTFHSRKRKQSKDTTRFGALSKRVTPFSVLRPIFIICLAVCLLLVRRAFWRNFSQAACQSGPGWEHRKNCIQTFSHNSPLASKAKRGGKKKKVEKSHCIFNAGHSAATSRVKAGSFLFADMQALAKFTLQPLQSTGRARRFVKPHYSSDLSTGSFVKRSDSTEA